MKVSGIDSLRATYSKEFVVELEPNLDDGKPWAVKLRQVRPIVYLLVGESIPVPAAGNGGGARFGRGELAKKYEAMRAVVARSAASVREAVQDDAGAWSERWTPITVVCDNEPGPGEIHIDEIDLPNTSNVTKCWNALFADAQAGGRMSGTADASFRQEGPGNARASGEDVQPIAARTRLGKVGRVGR